MIQSGIGMKHNLEKLAESELFAVMEPNAAWRLKGFLTSSEMILVLKLSPFMVEVYMHGVVS